MRILQTIDSRLRDELEYNFRGYPPDAWEGYEDWQFWQWCDLAWADDMLKPERATSVFLGDVPEIEWPAEWLAVPFVGRDTYGSMIGYAA